MRNNLWEVYLGIIIFLSFNYSGGAQSSWEGFSLISPQPNEVIFDSTEYIFMWNEGEEVSTYKLEVALDSNFSNMYYTKTTILGFDTLRDLHFQPYYYRVKAFDATDSVVSEIVPFEVFIPTKLASNAVSLFPETGVDTLLGGAVEKWTDLSGNDNHALQSISGSRPIKIDSLQINSYSPLYFDASNDYLQLTNPSVGQSEIFMLASFNFSVVWRSLLSATNHFDGLIYFFEDLGNNIISLWEGGKEIKFGNLTTASKFLNFELDAANSTLALNFENESSFFSNLLVDLEIQRIGASAFSPFDGYIYEVLIFNTILSANETDRVNNYLRWKYSPPINLGKDIVINTGFCDTTITVEDRFTSYQWMLNGNILAGETTNVLSAINETGLYKCLVTDQFGFSSEDSLYLRYSLFDYPLDTVVICLGDSVIWDTELSTSDFTFSWSDGSMDSLLSIKNAGTYVVTVTDGNACQRISDTLVAVVDSFSTNMTLGADKTLCQGNIISLESNQNEVISYLWDGGQTSPSIAIINSGNYTVSATNVNGCIGVDVVSVTINGIAPTAAFAHNDTCKGDTTFFQDLSFPNDGSSIVTKFWDFGTGDTSILDNPIYVFPDSGYFSVNLTVETNLGCSGSTSKMVRIFHPPAIDYSVKSFPISCVNTTVDFDAMVFFPGIDTIANLTWNFGDGTSIQNFLDTSNSYGIGDSTYATSLSVQSVGGCSVSKIKELRIDSTATLPSSFSLISPQQNEIIFDNSSYVFSWNISQGATRYRLEVSTDPSFSNNYYDTETSLNFDTVYNILPGDYYYRVTALNVCDETTLSELNTFKVFIPNLLNSNLVYLIPEAGVDTLLGGAVEKWTDLSGNNNHALQNTSNLRPIKVDSLPINSYTPIYFDATDDYLQLINPFVGKNQIFMLASFNFSTDLRSLLSANDHFNGLIYFDASSNNTVSIWEGGKEVKFGNIPVGPKFLNFEIDSANSAMALNFNYESSYLNSLAVDLEIQRIGASAFSPFNGNIYEIIVFDSTLSTNERETVNQYLRWKYSPPINLGPDLIVNGTFCDTVVIAEDRFVSYQWWEGNNLLPETSNILTGVNKDGVYKCVVTDIFGLQSEDDINVSFFNPSFAADTAILCVGDSITWAVELDTSIYDFSWSTGQLDSAIIINTPGDYWVTVHDADNCSRVSDTLTVTLDLFELSMSLGPDKSLCEGNSIFLESNQNEVVSYLWGGGQVTSSIAIDTSGAYSVTATNVNGCTGIDTVEVTIIGVAPTAVFNTNHECSGDSTRFTDSSFSNDGSQIVVWSWDFGDGDTSNVRNPVHLYSDTGNFIVSLVVTTDSGCSEIYRDTTIVYALPEGDILIGDSLLCSKDSLAIIGDSVFNAVSWNWDFGDLVTSNDTSTQQNTGYMYASSGNYLISAIIESDQQCLDTVFKTVSILESPDAKFIYDLLCVGDETTFLDNTVNANNGWDWNWKFGDGDSAIGNTVSHVYDEGGIFEVEMVVVNNVGCESRFTDSIFVENSPIAGFSITDFCVNTAIQVMDTTVIEGTPIVSWNWNVLNHENHSTEQHPYFNFKEEDLGRQYVLQLDVINAAGCHGSTFSTIDIHGQPVSDFSFTPEFGEPPLEVQFTDMTSGDAMTSSWIWTFGNGDSSFVRNPIYQFEDSGKFDLQLISADQYGCTDTSTDFIKVLFPILDMAITKVSADVDNDKYMIIDVQGANFGTREVNNFDLVAEISDGSTIREKWQGELFTLDRFSYQFNASYEIHNGELPHLLCVTIEEVNGEQDDDPTNNEGCTSLEQFVVFDPYPNPVEDKVRLEFILPERGEVDVVLYDNLGKYIRTIYKGEAERGVNRMDVLFDDLAADVYTIQVTYRDASENKKVLKLE